MADDLEHAPVRWRWDSAFEMLELVQDDEGVDQVIQLDRREAWLLDRYLHALGLDHEPAEAD